jgi:hypothetical protein
VWCQFCAFDYLHACSTIDLRRTASWSTRDAFTDGHLAEAREHGRPGLRTKAATSRAHAFRKFHPGAISMQRSSSDYHSAASQVYL